MRDEDEARRRRPPNRTGCKPIADVCVEHDEPLICRHGCTEAAEHPCRDRAAGLMLAERMKEKPRG